jgi:iron(III) transport system permease protein
VTVQAPIGSARVLIGDPDAPIAGRSGRRPPWWLWAAGIAVLIPVTVPVVFLFAKVFGASAAAWDALIDLRTGRLILSSALLVALVTATSLVIGVAAAWVVNRTTIGFAAGWAVLLSLPLVIPSYVIALSYLAAGGPRGLIADLTGFPIPLVVGLPGAWLALTLSTYPYVFLIAATALRRQDPALEEAAAGLGASSLRVFRSVTVPLLRPALGSAALLVGLYTLSDFGAVSLMRYDTFTRVIYAQYAGRLDRTPAAVLSAVLILIALAMIVAEGRTRGKATYASRRPGRRVGRRALRPVGNIAAHVFLSAVVAAGVMVPVGVLGAWFLRGIAAGEVAGVGWGAITGSVVGSGLAALIAMAAAVPVVVLAVRYPSPSTRWIERSVFVTFSLPHITVAMAVVVVSITILGPLYQSLTLLVVVYAAVFLAQATGPTRAALLQVDPSLEEASRSLGKGQFATLGAVTLPLIGRGILAGGALVFLTTMKELPVTLILRPTGFDTLAIRIWSAAQELFYARAAAAALLLLVVSAVPMYFLVIRNRGLTA